MNHHDLQEMCERYGLQVDFNITGVWEVTGAWPIRVLGRIGWEELRGMSYSDVELVVIECSVEAMGNGN